MSRTFLDHLLANNSAGLEVVWNRANDDERGLLVEAVRTEPGASEAHVFLKALLDAAAEGERLRQLRTGIDALSDLASRGSSDRSERLKRWLAVPPVREALLVTAAQRGADTSNELIEWLACADDDALVDALIPIFHAAVERRSGARLQLLADLSRRHGPLAPIAERYEQLKADSRSEWRAFVAGLGLPVEAVFVATCTFRAADPSIVVSIDPRRLNWYSLTWGAFEVDSTRRPDVGFPFEASVELIELPRRLKAYMQARGLRGRRKLHTSAGEEVRARLSTWVAGAT
jgi:hypothetical protein